MEAQLVQTRIEDAAASGSRFSLLLRGAHRLDVSSASVTADTAGGETRLEITGHIAIDGEPPRTGTVSVTSGDIASLFIEAETDA